MSPDLRKLAALENVRSRRESRLARLRGHHARQCEQMEQSVQHARQDADSLAHDVKRHQDKRWKALLGGTFDHTALLAASVQDDAERDRIEQAEQRLQQMVHELGEAKAKWEHTITDHVKALRKLETWRDFVDGQCRAHTRRKEIRSESTQEEQHGARHPG